MTESTQVTLLRRMTRSGGAEVVGNPLSSSRAVRLALTKAADEAVGLAVTVQSVAEELTGLDDMLGTLDDDLMLIGLVREGALVGLIGLDMEMRAAVLEMQTMGAVLPQTAELRPPTRTDKTLSDPLIAAFLTGFGAALVGTPLEGWLDSTRPDERIANARAAGLVLDDCPYRMVRLTVDLGVAERQAALLIALPRMPERAPPQAPPPVAGDWDTAFQTVLSETPAQLGAVLHRFPMSLAAAEALQVGAVLPLPGCSVRSVRLLAADGKEVAQAKLGQAAGHRAVRIELPPAPQLSDLPTVAPGAALPEPESIGALNNPSTLAVDIAGLGEAVPISPSAAGALDAVAQAPAMPADPEQS